jgi:hypothetical protein
MMMTDKGAGASEAWRHARLRRRGQQRNLRILHQLEECELHLMTEAIRSH